MRKVVAIFLIVCCLFLTGCSVKKVDELTDAEKFAKEFSISVDNKFVYADVEKVLEILNDKTAIVLFANSDDEKSIKAVSVVYEQAKKELVEEIYYFNPSILEEKKTDKYKKLSEKMDDMLGNDDFLVPGLYAIKDGKIINYSNAFSSEEELSEEYLTEKKLKQIKEDYSKVFNYKIND